MERLKIAIAASIEAGGKIMDIYDDPQADFGVERKADNSPLTRADKAAHVAICEALDKLDIPVLSEEGREIPYSERREWHQLWVVDPLDGTKEFIKRNGDFTVNIALVEDGDPVMGVIYIPVTRSLYYGVVGVGAFKVEDVKSGESVESVMSRGVALPLVGAERRPYTIVASLSHLSPETELFIDAARAAHGDVAVSSRGSSLKICMIAEGVADIYPRFAPTMEWDTAAGDAIVRASGGEIVRADDGSLMRYNKENLLNPFFIARG